MRIRNNNVGCKRPVIGVLNRHHRALLGSQLIDFHRGNTVVQLIEDFDDKCGVIYTRNSGRLTECF